MSKVFLPFDLGTQRFPGDPYLEDIVDHPVLDIGSSYSGLRSDVQAWLSANCDGWHFDCYLGGGEYYLRFRSEEDATAFRLRWL
jgi:hypothetical protein